MKLKMSRVASVATVAVFFVGMLSLASLYPKISSSHVRKADKITLLDSSSGRTLPSFFEGLKADPTYPLFRKRALEHVPSCDRTKVTQTSRVLQLLGLSFNSVVYAQGGCGDCGHQFNFAETWKCSSNCGGCAYDGPLQDASLACGIQTGGCVVCTAGPHYECPGKTPTEECSCVY